MFRGGRERLPHEVPHVRVRGFQIDRQAELAKPLAGGWPDRPDKAATRGGQPLVTQPDRFGHPKCMHKLLSRRQQEHIKVSGNGIPNRTLQRRGGAASLREKLQNTGAKHRIS